MNSSAAENAIISALRDMVREELRSLDRDLDTVRKEISGALVRMGKTKEVLSTPEACKALGCSVRQLRRWIASGQLTTVGISRRTQVTRASIDSLLASGPVRGASRRGTRTGTRPR